MKRTGNHRLRPERSAANKARAELAQLDAQIRNAELAKQLSLVAQLEERKAWLLVNSVSS